MRPVYHLDAQGGQTRAQTLLPCENICTGLPLSLIDWEPNRQLSYIPGGDIGTGLKAKQTTKFYTWYRYWHRDATISERLGAKQTTQLCTG